MLYNPRIIILTIWLITITKAYQFDNKLFNEFLANDLEMLNAETRTKRAVEPMNGCFPKRMPLCCGETIFEEFHKKQSNHKKECFEEVMKKNKESSTSDPFRCDGMEMRRHNAICIIECTWKKMGIIDDNSNLKEDELKKIFKEVASKETWFNAVQDKIVTTCTDFAKNITITSMTTNCRPQAIGLMHCLFNQIQMNCPEDAVKKNPIMCGHIRDGMKLMMDPMKAIFMGPLPPIPFLFFHDDK